MERESCKLKSPRGEQGWATREQTTPEAVWVRGPCVCHAGTTPGSSDASANKSPTFASEYYELGLCHLELKDSLLMHSLLFFLYQKIFSSYPTREKGALPELAQLISDTVPLTQLSWGVSVISLHCHWVLELYLPCKGTLKVKVNESVSSSAVSNSLVIPWTVACQAPLSMGFSRQEYWSALLFPSPGDLLNPGIKPSFSCIAGWFFTIWATTEGTFYATNIIFH